MYFGSHLLMFDPKDSGVEEQHLSIPKKSKRTVTLALPPERSPSASFDTMVPDSPDFEPRPGPITRRGTHVAEVKLSYWDLIKGLFTGVKNLRRKLAREIEWADPKEGRVKVRMAREPQLASIY